MLLAKVRRKVTSLFNAEMKKAGRTLETSICPHFKMSRTDLFNVIKVKQLKTLPEVMAEVGVNKDSLGCELCKPAIGSILSSL
jgi:nitrite reductase (NAD(P)H)